MLSFQEIRSWVTKDQRFICRDACRCFFATFLTYNHPGSRKTHARYRSPRNRRLMKNLVPFYLLYNISGYGFTPVAVDSLPTGSAVTFESLVAGPEATSRQWNAFFTGMTIITNFAMADIWFMAFSTIRGASFRTIRISAHILGILKKNSFHFREKSMTRKMPIISLRRSYTAQFSRIRRRNLYLFDGNTYISR